ncbi:MAG: hypothetical protein AAF568_01505, partial [Pseudomonadota bacterium]
MLGDLDQPAKPVQHLLGIARLLAINTQNYRVVMIREQAGDAEEMLDRLGRLIEIPEHQRR